MSAFKGTGEIIAIYKGTTNMSTAYKGTDLIFSGGFDKEFAPEVQLMPYYYDTQKARVKLYNTYAADTTSTATEGSTYYKYNKDTYTYDAITLAAGTSLAGYYSLYSSGQTVAGYFIGDGTNNANVFNKTKIKVPKTYGGLPIDVINSNAFKDDQTITTFSFSNAIKAIGYNAFYNTNYYNTASNWTSDGLLKMKTWILSADASSDTATITEDITICAKGAFDNRVLTSVYFNAKRCNNFFDSYGAFTKISGSYTEYPDTTLTIGPAVEFLPGYLFKGGFVSGYTSYGGIVVPANIIPSNVIELGSKSLLGSTNHILGTETEPFIIPSSITKIEECPAGFSGSTTQDYPKYIRFETPTVFSNFSTISHTKLIFSNKVKHIQTQSFVASSSTKLYFEHSANDIITFDNPIMTATSGAKSAYEVDIYSDCNAVKNDYDLFSSSSSITETLFRLDGSAWAALGTLSATINKNIVTIQPLANADYYRIYFTNKAYVDLPFSSSAITYDVDKFGIHSGIYGYSFWVMAISTGDYMNSNRVNLSYKKYQRVDYIESTGTQYINTGYVYKSIPAVNWKSQIVTHTNGEYWGFGEKTNSSFLVNDDAGYSNRIDVWIGNQWSAWTFTASTEAVVTWDITRVNSNNDHVSFSNDSGDSRTEHAYNGDITQNTLPLLIFKGRAANYVKMRLYSFIMYDTYTSNTGKIVMNFFPCYDIVTGEAGLWEGIGSKFYGNAGTGAFLKGADM